jgi:hypothetical protein
MREGTETRINWGDTEPRSSLTAATKPVDSINVGIFG